MNEKESLELEKAKLQLGYAKELAYIEERIKRLEISEKGCHEPKIEERVYPTLIDTEITWEMLLEIGNYADGTADEVKRYFHLTDFDKNDLRGRMVNISFARLHLYTNDWRDSSELAAFWYEIQESLGRPPYSQKYIRLANPYELLSFGATYPEVHRQLPFPLIALGTNRRRASCFPYLYTNDEGRRLIKLWSTGPIFNMTDWLFAAIGS